MKLRSGRIISKTPATPSTPNNTSSKIPTKTTSNGGVYCGFCGKVHSNVPTNNTEKDSDDILRGKTMKVIMNYLTELEKTRGRLNKCRVVSKMFTFIKNNLDYFTSTQFHSQGKNNKFVQTVYDKCIELEGDVITPNSTDPFSDEYIEESRDIEIFYHLIKTIKTKLEFQMNKYQK